MAGFSRTLKLRGLGILFKVCEKSVEITGILVLSNLIEFCLIFLFTK